MSTTTIDNLHDKARQAVESGESKFREAAQYLGEARSLGATQRQSAEAIGRSQRWVCGLLQWLDDGCKGAPFEKRKPVQRDTPPTQKKKSRPATDAEQANAQAAKAQAQRAKAEAQKAKADAARARSENAKAQAEARRARAESFANMFGGHREKKTIHSGPRELLVKALGMLGSEHAGERDNAARMVEKQRRKLGMTWDELIVPAAEEMNQAA
jgi:nucleoid-associated protein YgaU